MTSGRTNDDLIRENLKLPQKDGHTKKLEINIENLEVCSGREEREKEFR